ncbi:MAG: cupredoxin domain-containing protein [Candidatus Staskawiczbacteria bacterium]|jgi:plastocyanin
MEKVNKISLGIIALLLVAIVFLLVNGGSQKQISSLENNTNQQPVVIEEDFMKPHIPADLTAEQSAQLKLGINDHEPTNLTFNIVGGSFYFAPNEISVKQGDKVKIIFTNAGGTHNLMFVDFGGIGTKTIKTGESDTIEFTADKKGTFEFYCSVGNGYHRMKGQIGILIVR